MRGKSAAERAKILERQRQALEMRRNGFSYRKIGERLHIDHSMAFKDVQNALAALTKERNKEAEYVRELELQRLDMLLEGLSRLAEIGNPIAVDKFLRVCESRRKLLGLDAPTKVIIEGGVPVETINEFIRQAMTAGYDASDYFNELIRDLATHPGTNTTGT